MRLPVALPLAFALLAAGCLSAAPEAGPDAPGPAEEDLSDLIVVDHDHTDASLHTAATPNLVEVGFTDLSLDGRPTDSNSALDVHGTWVVSGLVGETSGFAIVDASDPANPRVVSRFSAPHTYGADVKFDSTGDLVFLATQWAGDPASPTNLLDYDPARAPEGPMVWGVYVVDVSDKASPRLESFLPLYRGAHAVHYHEIGGEPYVFMCTYHWLNTAVDSQENPLATKVVVGKLERGPDGNRRITPVSEYTRNVDPSVVGGDDRVFPHELSVSEAPIDGKTYAWVSYWDHGLVVLDVTDPANLREAGRWAGFEPGDGAIHYAATFPYLVHGRQVTIAGPEWTSHDYSGKWWALDTTDLSDIKTIGWWTLPGAPPFDANYRFSPHNFDLYGTWVIGANYHAGVWVWDVDRLVRHYVPDEEEDPGTTPSSFRAPLGDMRLHGESMEAGHGDLVDVVGYFMKGREPRSTYYGGESPLVWMALLRDGHLYLADMETGVRIVRFTDVHESADGFVMKGADG